MSFEKFEMIFSSSKSYGVSDRNMAVARYKIDRYAAYFCFICWINGGERVNIIPCRLNC